MIRRLLNRHRRARLHRALARSWRLYPLSGYIDRLRIHAELRQIG